VSTTPILEVDDLRVHYISRAGTKVHAVDGVSFRLAPGEVLGIAGESGCGKTTLVSACMGLFLPPLYFGSGDVRIRGESILGNDPQRHRKYVLGRKIAMIPQGALNSLNPTRKIKPASARSTSACASASSASASTLVACSMPIRSSFRRAPSSAS
jgi:peptide/nickel transport system ATP-binding protein